MRMQQVTVCFNISWAAHADAAAEHACQINYEQAAKASTAAPEQLGEGRCLQFFLMVIILAVVIIIILKVAGVGALKNAPLPLPTFKVRALLFLPTRLRG